MIRKFATAAAVLFFATCVAQAADFDKIPDATKNIKKGQWVSYQTMGGNQKQTVTDVTGSGDDREITISMEMSMAGQTLPAQEQVISVREAKAAQQEAWNASPDTKITEEKVTVNGKDWDAVVVETAQEGMKIRIYMSEQVPVSGILKMEIDGMPDPMMVLDGYGE